jgi:hypothetical protein
LGIYHGNVVDFPDRAFHFHDVRAEHLCSIPVWLGQLLVWKQDVLGVSSGVLLMEKEKKDRILFRVYLVGMFLAVGGAWSAHSFSAGLAVLGSLMVITAVVDNLDKS